MYEVRGYNESIRQLEKIGVEEVFKNKSILDLFVKKLIQKEYNKMARRGLYTNINARKKQVLQDQNLEVQLAKKAYANMKAGFPKKKKYA